MGGSKSRRAHVGALKVSSPAATSHQAAIGVSQEIQKVVNLSCWKLAAGSEGCQEGGQ